ncbi:MAG: dTDP-4-dehydrorhamnose 3,5-epimerase [Thermomonas sp.]
MNILQTRLPGCVAIEPDVHGDARGFFYEAWNAARFAAHGLPAQFVQHNVSRSQRGVLRGLHYQWPGNPQGKLVGVLEGEVYDVAVDLRRDSPTFGQHAAAILSAGNRRQFWIPEGFAHGFLVLSENALRWDDPRLAIDWPLAEVQLSDKDANAPFLDAIPPERLPRCLP